MRLRLPTRRTLLIGALLLAAAALLLRIGGGPPAAARYHCPMHPAMVSDRPGDCAVCGMRLVADEAGPPAAGADADAVQPATGGERVIEVSAKARRMAGIRTEPAALGHVTRTVRVPGTVVADPGRVQHVTLRLGGFIQKLEVRATGGRVERGQTLLTLYAPDFVPAQEEYLRYLRTREALQRPAAVAEAEKRSEEQARRRIERYGFGDAFIDALAGRGTASAVVPIVAPAAGFVQLGPIFEGQQVEAGMDLMTITDLREVWVEAELFESDTPGVGAGREASVIPPLDPPVVLAARIAQVNPFLDQASRTTKVRLLCANRDLALKPGMLVAVEIPVQSGEGVVVPAAAVLESGQRRVAFVEAGDDRFEVRRVRVGMRAGDRVLVLGGLAAGERVAVQGTFLLDAEARLQGLETAEDGGGRRP